MREGKRPWWLGIGWLQAASQSAVAVRLGLSWDEMHAIRECAWRAGLAHWQAETA